jgi:hypothetical protein
MHAHRMAHEAALAAARARAEANLTGGGAGRAVGSPYFVPPRFGAVPRIPGIPQMGNNAPVSSYDPYLPCNSIHFYNSFNIAGASTSGGTERLGQRRRHPAGDQTSTTTGSITTPTAQPTANSQGQATSISLQNNGDIGRIIGDVISQISGGGPSGNPEQIQVNIGGRPGQISIGLEIIFRLNFNKKLIYPKIGKTDNHKTTLSSQYSKIFFFTAFKPNFNPR